VRGRRAATALILLVLIVALLVLPVSARDPLAPSMGSRILAGAPIAPAANLSNSTSAGWLTFLGNENRSGDTPAIGPEQNHTLWTSSVTGVGQIPIHTSPIVTSDRIYVASAHGVVYALNRTDNGSVLWTYLMGGTPTTGDLAGSRLIFANSTGGVVALDPVTGSVGWDQDLGGPILDGVSVANGSVFVGTGAQVAALDLDTGRIEWRTTLSSSIAGALAIELGRIFATTVSGQVDALSLTGAILWDASVGAPLSVSPVATSNAVLVADTSSNITSLNASTGAVLWRWTGSSSDAQGGFAAAVAVGDGLVYAETGRAQQWALNASSGAVVWEQTLDFNVNNPTLTSPIVSATGLYVIASGLTVFDLELANGLPLWQTQLEVPTLVSPGLADGELIVATDSGEVIALGSPGATILWPVTGTVDSSAGAPIPNATVSGPGIGTTSGPQGQFSFELPTGIYQLVTSAAGFGTTQMAVNVSGPTQLRIVLSPIPEFLFSGVVTNSRSGLGIANVTFLVVASSYGSGGGGVSGPGGRFAFLVPAGTDTLTFGGPSDFSSSSVTITVRNAPIAGAALTLDPLGLSLASSDPYYLIVWLPLVAVGVALIGVGGWDWSRRRALIALPGPVLTPFARFVAMRSLLIPVQAVGILLILFSFGSFLPAAALGTDPCTFSAGACSTCSWSNWACVTSAFGQGFGRFTVNIFTGQWGSVAYGSLVAPATQFMQWWLPNSIELAVAALLFSAVLAYVLGLYAGWRREGGFDATVRLASVVGLLVPSFLVAVFVINESYQGIDNTFGQFAGGPFGVIPPTAWLYAHGGIPNWIGLGDNTLPTGFPLIDGIIHQDWDFEALVLVKVLIQALIIAVIYVSIFLRYARNAAAGAAEETYILAARARGVSGRTILWRHLGRRVIPIYLLLFGLTLPIYIGTQALVEAVANDQGVGTLLLVDMTGVRSSGFHIVGGVGNFYQVAIFLLLLLVLAGNLFADILARFYDPRLAAKEYR
jgi:ABC-type dipeptide/oligopeptide/nickel transport system permease component/outer membrane protein assembly factor BamB